MHAYYEMYEWHLSYVDFYLLLIYVIYWIFIYLNLFMIKCDKLCDQLSNMILF